MRVRNRTLVVVMVLAGGLLASAAGGAADDWPQYRYDAGRTAAAPRGLSAELHLQWVRQLAPPRRAYPRENRLAFDASYQPIVMGGVMFVPSMVTDSVTALDAATGRQKWRFHAGGPVRLSPAGWAGKVYFVSDDGHLYCLDAATGRLRWKFRGLPAGVPDRKVLGEQRLISLRPARGGPVVHDGTVYFAAGIWPSEGVYVHALNAETGKVVWSNTDSSRIPLANPDHNQKQYAGLAPQGHLAVVGDMLIVPNGRQLAGFLDRKTGKRGPYTMGWGGRPWLAKGSSFVAGTGRYLFLSGDMYDTALPGGYGKGSRLLAGTFSRIQVDDACDRLLGRFRQPVLTEKVAYYWQSGGPIDPAAGAIQAFDLTRPTAPPAPKPRPKPRRGVKLPPPKPACMRFPLLWQLPSKLTVHIKAGPRLYAGGKGVVAAVDLPEANGPATISWRARIDGTPVNMLAAAGRLFVATDRGHILAFGAEKSPRPQTHRAPAPGPQAAPDRSTRTVAAILRATKVTTGHALVLGLADGRMVAELVRQSKLYVIALDPDADKVAALRERFARVGLYGTRVSILVGDPVTFPLPPYMATLIVSERFDAMAKASDGALARSVYRPLRPYGGTACLPVPAARNAGFLAAVAEAKLPGSVVAEADGLVLLTRRGPLVGAADWSHPSADAGNTNTSQDRRVKAPLGLLWFDGSARWNRNGTLVLVAGGRMFLNEHRLYAMDVYTGRHLWSRARPGAAIVADDGLYVVDRKACELLDPATGRVKARIPLPPGLQGWRDVRVVSDVLIGTAPKHVVALDRRSGKIRWKHPLQRIPRLLATGGGKVFVVDQTSWIRPRPPARPIKQEGRTVALDAETGKVLWEVPRHSDTLRYSTKHDVLVTAHGTYQGADGKRLHTSGRSRGAPPAIIGDRLVGEYGDTYNLLTGAVIYKAAPWRKRGCTRPRMSVNMITTRAGGYVAYFDLATRRMQDFPGIRPACINNLVPADGLLNAPGLTGGCTCNYAASSYALVPAAALIRAAPSEK